MGVGVRLQAGRRAGESEIAIFNLIRRMTEREIWNIAAVDFAEYTKRAAGDFAEHAKRRLHDKISVITGRKGRRRPGFGCRVEAVRVLDGSYTVYRNIPEWCLYSGRGIVDDYECDRPLYRVSPLSCDRIMTDSAIGAVGHTFIHEPTSIGCRYTDCVNRGCVNCRGAYKGVGAFMELRERLREAGHFYSSKRSADAWVNSWPLRVESFLPGGWRISKNLSKSRNIKKMTADD